MSLPNIFPPSIFVLPEQLNLFIVAGLIFALIAEIRKRYIGRPGIVANSLLVIEIMGPHWCKLPVIAQLYLYGAVIVCVIAGLAYLTHTKLSTEFYNFCFIVYGSLSVLMIIILMHKSIIPTY